MPHSIYALAAALLTATAPLEIRPVADARKLVSEVSHGKPVVLHFWATWCGACREEFPKLRQMLHGFEKSGVSVLLISIDSPKQAAAAQAMLKKFGVADLPSILLDAPSPDPVAAAFEEPKWTGDLPATFVYDAAGKKVQSFLGMVEPKALRKAVHQARKLSAATPAPAQR